MYETLLGETYAKTTVEEVLRARVERDEAKKRYNNKYKDYLITCLCNVGFANKDVIAVPLHSKGVLRVEECSYSTLHPYKINFYPYKKDGGISAKSKGVPHFWVSDLSDLCNVLKHSFQLAGDENAS